MVERIDFGILLGLAYQRFVDDLRAHLAARGFDDLGPTYGYVFRALAQERLSQRELARRLSITDQGMAKTVSEMVERGYLERGPDASDARVKRLRLSRRGRAALAAARAFHAAFAERLGAEVGASEVQRLERLLSVVAGKHPEDPAGHARLRPM
jgi:DNA-binding MarR family transcriptional regulator